MNWLRWERRTHTIHRLSLQFDAGQITHGNNERQVRQAVELINLTLQREPFGLGAQLIVHPDEIEIESRQSDPGAQSHERGGKNLPRLPTLNHPFNQ